jgi:hypothetical protein
MSQYLDDVPNPMHFALKLSEAMMLFRIACMILVLVGLALAEDDKGKGNAANVPSGALLEITINPTHQPIVFGSTVGLWATIKNVGSGPLTLYEKQTCFRIPPEVGYEDQLYCVRFSVPGTSINSSSAPGGSSDPGGGKGQRLDLAKGDSTTVSITISNQGGWAQALTEWRDPKAWSTGQRERRDFRPGKYPVDLNVQFQEGDGQTPYRIARGSTDVEFSASTGIILTGAFLGGLLAYLIKLYYAVPTKLTAAMPEGKLKWILSKTEWLAAGLFGAALTILASRLSDTFPVRASANDLLGAVTLGFVFQWMGVGLLEKLPGISKKIDNPPPQNPPPAAGQP